MSYLRRGGLSSTPSKPSTAIALVDVLLCCLWWLQEQQGAGRAEESFSWNMPFPTRHRRLTADCAETVLTQYYSPSNAESNAGARREEGEKGVGSSQALIPVKQIVLQGVFAIDCLTRSKSDIPNKITYCSGITLCS